MTHLKLFLLLFVFISDPNSLYADNGIINRNDSIFKKIKENEKNFKLQRSKLLTKTKENDCNVIYSVDKKSSKITLIHLIKKVSNSESENTFYWFNDGLLFKITISVSNKTSLGIWRSQNEAIYYFSNDSLFYKEEKGISKDINLLLVDTKKYLTKGNTILKE